MFWGAHLCNAVRVGSNCAPGGWVVSRTFHQLGMRMRAEMGEKARDWLPLRGDDPYVAFRPEFPDMTFSPADSALLVVDVQYGCVDREYGFLRAAEAAGRTDAAEYYCNRVEAVLENVGALLSAFRSCGATVCHSRIGYQVGNGNDRSLLHKRLGLGTKVGSREADFVERVSPVEGEVVFTKTASSVFNSTNIHYTLLNLGIRQLAVCGVVTTGCVESAVRDAADLGYAVALIEDACAAVVEEMHWASVRALRDVYCKVYSTRETIQRIGWDR